MNFISRKLYQITYLFFIGVFCLSLKVIAQGAGEGAECRLEGENIHISDNACLGRAMIKMGFNETDLTHPTSSGEKCQNDYPTLCTEMFRYFQLSKFEEYAKQDPKFDKACVEGEVSGGKNRKEARASCDELKEYYKDNLEKECQISEEEVVEKEDEGKTEGTPEERKEREREEKKKQNSCDQWGNTIQGFEEKNYLLKNFIKAIEEKKVKEGDEEIFGTALSSCTKTTDIELDKLLAFLNPILGPTKYCDEVRKKAQLFGNKDAGPGECVARIGGQWLKLVAGLAVGVGGGILIGAQKALDITPREAMQGLIKLSKLAWEYGTAGLGKMMKCIIKPGCLEDLISKLNPKKIFWQWASHNVFCQEREGEGEGEEDMWKKGLGKLDCKTPGNPLLFRNCLTPTEEKRMRCSFAGRASAEIVLAVGGFGLVAKIAKGGKKVSKTPSINRAINHSLLKPIKYVARKPAKLAAGLVVGAGGIISKSYLGLVDLATLSFVLQPMLRFALTPVIKVTKKVTRRFRKKISKAATSTKSGFKSSFKKLVTRVGFRIGARGGGRLVHERQTNNTGKSGNSSEGGSSQKGSNPEGTSSGGSNTNPDKTTQPSEGGTPDNKGGGETQGGSGNKGGGETQGGSGKKEGGRDGTESRSTKKEQGRKDQADQQGRKDQADQQRRKDQADQQRRKDEAKQKKDKDNEENKKKGASNTLKAVIAGRAAHNLANSVNEQGELVGDEVGAEIGSGAGGEAEAVEGAGTGTGSSNPEESQYSNQPGEIKNKKFGAALKNLLDPKVRSKLARNFASNIPGLSDPMSRNMFEQKANAISSNLGSVSADRKDNSSSNSSSNSFNKILGDARKQLKGFSSYRKGKNAVAPSSRRSKPSRRRFGGRQNNFNSAASSPNSFGSVSSNASPKAYDNQDYEENPEAYNQEKNIPTPKRGLASVHPKKGKAAGAGANVPISSALASFASGGGGSSGGTPKVSARDLNTILDELSGSKASLLDIDKFDLNPNEIAFASDMSEQKDALLSLIKKGVKIKASTRYKKGSKALLVYEFLGGQQFYIQIKNSHYFLLSKRKGEELLSLIL